MKLLAIAALILAPSLALAQSPPPEPTVTLTQSELAIHDEAIGAKAVAQYIFNESSQRAHAVEAKLSAAFTPKPPATPVPTPTGAAK